MMKATFGVGAALLSFAGAVGTATASSSTNTSTASTTLHIAPGGFVDVAVPSGNARAVSVELRDVTDERGRVAVFRLDAVRGARVVESRRVILRVPGGTVTQAFNRAFDRIRINDGEGTLAADVGEVTFCPVSMASPHQCLSANGTQAATVSSKTDRIGETIPQASGTPEADAPTSTPVTTAPAAVTPVATAPTTTTPISPTSVSTTPVVTSPTSVTPTVADPVADATPVVTSPSLATVVTDLEPVSAVTEPVTEGVVSTDTTAAQDEAATDEPVSEDTAFHGETTPISRIEKIVVQGGPEITGYYAQSTIWADQFKNSQLPQYTKYGQSLLATKQIETDEFGVAVLPDTYDFAGGERLSFGRWWSKTETFGAIDVAGRWRVYLPDGYLASSGDMTTVVKDSDFAEFECAKGEQCTLSVGMSGTPEPGALPQVVQLTDGDGRSLSDDADLKAGMVTRQLWREAMAGYSVLRPMDNSAATSPAPTMIRYDDFATMDHASWNIQSTKIAMPGQDSVRDIQNGTGVDKAWAPMPARLRAAWELGAVYHHNFPHLFLESRDNFDEDVIGVWFKEFMADESIDLDKKLSMLNDYELQHVDEFGADVVANQEYLVGNMIKIEVSNETWNYGYPWGIQTNYMKRKAEARWSDRGITAGSNEVAQAVQTGYDLTKAIARLRKKHPEVEWRGVMAVQTASAAAYAGAGSWKPNTPSGRYNETLHGMIVGYQQFWEDYERNELEWSENYAPEPARPGDWFEAQGTTYFDLSARSSSGKTTLGGMAPSTFLERIADPADWDALRRDLMDGFFDGSVSGQLSLPSLTNMFEALAEHAAFYGMQVTSYEGGNHTDLGTHWLGKVTEYPQLKDFNFDLHRSTEMALMQTAVHDAAIAAGWIGLADYSTFQPGFWYNMFGARKNFGDVTPIWCEYVRWMDPAQDLPEGVEAGGFTTPQQKCGAMVDYLNQAKANGYYLGDDTIAAPETLLP